jgi:hypothetical protein
VVPCLTNHNGILHCCYLVVVLFAAALFLWCFLLIAVEEEAWFEEVLIGVTFVVLDVFSAVAFLAAGFVVFAGTFFVDVCAFTMLPIRRKAKTGIKYFFIILFFK